MRALNPNSNRVLAGIIAILAITYQTHASTIWNGPTTAFSHTQENNAADQMTPDVSITRSASGGLYNSAMESTAVSGTSPKGTAWAIGTLAKFTNNPSSLTFGPCPLEAGGHPPGYIGTNFVVHLTSASDDIYLQLTLTGWGGAGGSGDKTFSYTRTTPAAAPPPTPTVTITNPVSGATFAAPASVNIGASCTVSSGTVTNVQFFTNNVSLKNVTTPPFTVVANLAAGAFALKAVATAAGVSGTSAVVNITITSATAPTVSLTNPPNNAVFSAPAQLKLGASASAGNGSVTNVRFFANTTTLLGSATAAPFTAVSSSLNAGAYTLTAVATAAGISATSAPVNVSVVTPSQVNVSGAVASGGRISFNYSDNPGLSYEVQGSPDLVHWVSLATNTPTSSPQSFSSPDSSPEQYYRIELLPNP